MHLHDIFPAVQCSRNNGDVVHKGLWSDEMQMSAIFLLSIIMEAG